MFKEVARAAQGLERKPAIEPRGVSADPGEDFVRIGRLALGGDNAGLADQPGIANAFVAAVDICRRSGRGRWGRATRPVAEPRRGGQAVIMESQNSPGPLGPGELVFSVSNQ